MVFGQVIFQAWSGSGTIQRGNTSQYDRRAVFSLKKIPKITAVKA
jgi:hypothetical protein